jgi:ubiquinone biosynthesis protein
MGRVREILGVFVRHGFGEVIDRSGIKGWFTFSGRLRLRRREAEQKLRLTLEERIRMCFEDLGPTFIKLGQVLGTRPDLIPMSLVLELRKLQDQVPPFPAADALNVFETDLGAHPDEVFEFFDEIPLAAASIAQVHKAKLRTGEDVAVKIQRPELGRVINQDLQIIRGLANLIHEKVPEVRQFDLPGIAREFSAALRLESDFTNERFNMERFAKLWEEDPLVSAPRTYPDLCSARILTMEYIDGVKVTDIEGLERIEADNAHVAQLGTAIALKSIFDHGFFHADPHPGNFFVLPGGRITLIDFGMMGNLDRQRLDELLSFLIAILTNDPDMMVRLFIELDIIHDETDVRALKREIKLIIDRYNHVPIGEIDIGRFIEQVFQMVIKHDVRLPADLMLVAKAITTMEGIAQEIAPHYDPIEEMRPYLMKTYVLHTLDPARHAKEVARDVGELTLLVRSLPHELRVLLKKLRKGQFRLVTSEENFSQIQEQQNRRVNRIITAVLSMGLFGTAALLTANDYEGTGPTIMYILATGFLLWSWRGIWRSGGL